MAESVEARVGASFGLAGQFLLPLPASASKPGKGACQAHLSPRGIVAKLEISLK